MKTKTFSFIANKEIEVCVTLPSSYILQNQKKLLPGWKSSVSQLILFLQKSNISFKGSSHEIMQEKDCLRVNFLRFGTNLIFALRDLSYESDLFDPRNGYPLLTQPGDLSLDDNAVVKAILNYPALDYDDCTLLQHPTWGDRIYPSTIATAAPQAVVEPLTKKLLKKQQLNFDDLTL